MAFITTVHTGKQGLTTPIAFVNLSTLAAFLAGCLGQPAQRNSRKQALILQELPELVESQIAVSGSFLLANLCPRADAFQFFDSNHTVCVEQDHPAAD
jgi:hypothetical protein